MALHWYDKSEWNGLRKEAINDFTGKFPEKENEIMAPLAALKELGILKPEAGQKIYLPCLIDGKNVKKEFVLSGYYKEYVIARVVDFSHVFNLQKNTAHRPAVKRIRSSIRIAIT